MSRIDEALKRASQTGSLAGKEFHRTTETPLRLAEDVILNEYPAEGRSSPARAERIATHAEFPSPVTQPNDTQVAVKGIGLPADEKLVRAPSANALSVEQYRRLASMLHDAQTARGLKSIIVTSAVPMEGKTLTVANLALTLSESYKRRVLLIDADLRRPSVHNIFRIAKNRGLSEVLRGDRFDSAEVRLTPQLSVLLSGHTDQNPTAALSSDRMRQLVEDCKQKFDWVLLDTPPIGLLSDAQIIVRLAQSALFVIRAGVTPFAAVERAIEELGRDYVLGTVLNGVELQALPARGYYDGYYTAGEGGR